MKRSMTSAPSQKEATEAHKEDVELEGDLLPCSILEEDNKASGLVDDPDKNLEALVDLIMRDDDQFDEAYFQQVEKDRGVLEKERAPFSKMWAEPSPKKPRGEDRDSSGSQRWEDISIDFSELDTIEKSFLSKSLDLGDETLELPEIRSVETSVLEAPLIRSSPVQAEVTLARQEEEVSCVKETQTDVLSNVRVLRNIPHKTVVSTEVQTELDDLSQDSSFFGLPEVVKILLADERGIRQLYQWQVDCLNLPAVRERKNLIYSLPTSGGKTLVAEILILREVVLHRKNAIFVLPYVAIVQEKVIALSTFAVSMDFQIEEYAGNRGVLPPPKKKKSRCVYVCTIEKAHSIVNALIESSRLQEVGIVVFDELHMLGCGTRRGASLECMITKLKFCRPDIQLVGMSATIGNLDELAAFMAAEVYSGNFRPVPLTEYIKLDNRILRCNVNDDDRLENFEVCREVSYKYPPELRTLDPDLLLGLVMEVIPRHSCLVFCPTKRQCENIARMFLQYMPSTLKAHRIREKRQLAEALKIQTEGSVCPILARSVELGVAYHHGGLTTDERKLIEEAYQNGTLCCLTCTSTLAAGVNLPAKRVILRAPYVGKDFISLSVYKQMVGRSGRAGIDEHGESILMLHARELQRVEAMMSSGLETCTSSLVLDETHTFQILLLSAVALQIASSTEALEKLVASTFYAMRFGIDQTRPREQLRRSIKSLQEAGLMEPKIMSRDFAMTRMGTAVFKSGMDIREAQTLYSRIQKSLLNLNLVNSLHLTFLVTPKELVEKTELLPDVLFQVFFSFLNDEERSVLERIGVQESCIVKLMTSRTIGEEDERTLRVFYVALVLYDLFKRKSIAQMSERYRMQRGTLQAMMSTTVAFSSCVLRFSEQLPEFWGLNSLMPEFCKRLAQYNMLELVPLLELPYVKMGRARQLCSAGYRTLRDIATSTEDELCRDIKFMPRKVSRQIITVARLLLQQKMQAVEEEAEEMVAECRSMNIR